MTTKQLTDNFLNTIVDTVQVAYSAPSDKNVVIESFTVANNSSINASYKAYIKSATGLLSPILPFKVVIWGETDLGISIVNQAIPAGGTLQVESSALNSLYFTVTGRVLS
ncbi:MAG: hypothetical protein Unbinned1520contig1002_8 [Prokaryotic dsDNA virus sp.]|nr:MAG: hypothetical protein Unbinned1520contig1002_8 [Prokaryotic dsDNA virus sp.]|tara:strand:+ start:23954 stop:24283 length:330 start_codon:yes stop_codon:yes gene_type:complete